MPFYFHSDLESLCETKILSLKKRHFSQVIFIHEEDMPTLIQPTFLTPHQKTINEELECTNQETINIMQYRNRNYLCVPKVVDKFSDCI